VSERSKNKILLVMLVVLGICYGFEYNLSTKLTQQETEHNTNYIQLVTENDILSEQVKDLSNELSTLKGIDPYLSDIKKYVLAKKGISLKIKEDIFDAIVDGSTKYNLNPLVVTALIDVESSFRFWIEHQKTLVTLDNGKKQHIQAVGLGGVVWEFWGKKLVKADIATTRSDLFNPEVNVLAICFILDNLTKKKLKEGAKTPMESALLRYFGGNYKSYLKKVSTRTFDIIKHRLM
jgi:cell division protein FtsB